MDSSKVSQCHRLGAKHFGQLGTLLKQKELANNKKPGEKLRLAINLFCLTGAFQEGLFCVCDCIRRFGGRDREFYA